MKHVEKLKVLNPCPEAVRYAAKYRSLKEAWQKCDRGDWLLWYAGKLSGSPKSASRRKVVLAACACARLALKYTKDPRANRAIETAEAWAKNKSGVMLNEVRFAADAADADAEAAAYAADAEAAAYAADADAYAAYAAAYAAYAAAEAEARRKTLKKYADIVRKHYPVPPRGKQLRGGR